MRLLFEFLPAADIWQTLSAKLVDPMNCPSVSGKSAAIRPDLPKVRTASQKSTLKLSLPELANSFPLPWSHYVMLISRSRSSEAFQFY